MSKCASYGNDGTCGLDWGDDEDMRPSSCDDYGLCFDDGEDNGCTEFDVFDEVCDYCGEPLGFCAKDCETRQDDFEDE